MDKCYIQVRDYPSGKALFDYVFVDFEPQVNDLIEAGGKEYRIVGRLWINGRLCLLVSNAGVVKG